MASPSYRNWLKAIGQIRGWDTNEMLNDPTYNYELFYNKRRADALDMLNKNSEAHFSDIGKTSDHPTFSNESYYSGKVNKRYNPSGIIGGTWSEYPNRYTLSPSQMKNGWNVGRTIKYLENAEDEGVELMLPNNVRPRYDGDIWGGVLPNVNIIGKRKKK